MAFDFSERHTNHPREIAPWLAARNGVAFWMASSFRLATRVTVFCDWAYDGTIMKLCIRTRKSVLHDWPLCLQAKSDVCLVITAAAPRPHEITLCQNCRACVPDSGKSFRKAFRPHLSGRICRVNCRQSPASGPFVAHTCIECRLYGVKTFRSSIARAANFLQALQMDQSSKKSPADLATPEMTSAVGAISLPLMHTLSSRLPCLPNCSPIQTLKLSAKRPVAWKRLQAAIKPESKHASCI